MSSMNFDFRFGPQGGTPIQSAVLRIGILGDFGSSSRLRCRRIDLDNFEERFAEIATDLSLPLGKNGAPVTIKMEEFDSLHPDTLYDELELFAELRSQRRSVGSTASADSALAEWGFAKSANEPAPAAGDGGASSLADLLNRPMSEAPVAAARTDSAQSRAQAWIDKIVAPHVIQEPAPVAESAIASFDGLIADRMRAILQAAEFRAIERLWRGLKFVLSRIEDDSVIQVDLIDISKAGLAESVSGEHPLASPLATLLREQAGEMDEGTPWGVLLGCYRFGADSADGELLARLGTIAASLNAPFIADAAPELCGSADFATLPSADLADPPDWWQELRQSQAADYLSLAAPGFLLRYPYGEQYEPLDFDFEELESPFLPDGYLWGHAALACVQVIIDDFTRRAWSQAPRMGRLSELPCCTHEMDGEMVALPFAECWLSDRLHGALMDRGLIPLVAVRHTDQIRLDPLQSLAGAPLQGRWG